MDPIPASINEISDPEQIRVQLYASNQSIHAPLVQTVEAGANGRLLPAGGEQGQVLTKNSATDYDAVWSSAIGLRAFANIDGTAGSVALREGQNISGVTENATGDITLSFSESITSSAAVTVTAGDTGTPGVYVANLVEITTTSARFQIRDGSGTLTGADTICVIVAGIYSNFLLLSGDMQDTTLDKEELSGDQQLGDLKISGDE